MTQKELLYVEDIYNHENLLLDLLNSSLDTLDECYEALISDHIKIHNENIKCLNKLMKGLI